ncbi:MAG: hypothetical protein DWQ36_01815 [Acidobacteria bacterium]|nr:MAG: hypothetical protein DWQ36_01815 [Acidobacteriota bacterium]
MTGAGVRSRFGGAARRGGPAVPPRDRRRSASGPLQLRCAPMPDVAREEAPRPYGASLPPPRRICARPSGLIGLLVVLAPLVASACAAPDVPPATLDAGGDGPEPRAWVTIFDPRRSAPGYNLDLFRQRTPTLFDANGRVVHSWPQARVKSRVRLLPDGNLLGLGLGPAVFEYSWQGDLVWSHRFEAELPHHDVIRLRNGNTLVISQRDGSATDDLVEIERQGREIWRWRSDLHLGDLIEQAGRRGGQNLTHFNSVQELPSNRWHDGGDTRFRPGNLLVSARNLDHLLVIDRATGDVVWTFGERLDMQHEALMVPPGEPRAGAIFVLSNGTRGRYHDTRSALLEIDPSRRAVVREWTDASFFTNTGGTQQPLAGGNTLITSTRGGRTFELTPDGEIVWEWIPPFDPVRTLRYPVDHAPQLAALGRPHLEAVTPEDGYRFVERRAFRFAHRRDIVQRVVAGERRRVLRHTALCGQLLLPMQAELQLGFGVPAFEVPATTGPSSHRSLRPAPAADAGRAAARLRSARLRSARDPGSSRFGSRSRRRQGAACRPLRRHRQHRGTRCKERRAPRAHRATASTARAGGRPLTGRVARGADRSRPPLATADHALRRGDGAVGHREGSRGRRGSLGGAADRLAPFFRWPVEPVRRRGRRDRCRRRRRHRGRGRPQRRGA